MTESTHVPRAAAPPPLHEHVERFGFLLGVWRGQGRGDYPTIEPFAYREEVTFGHVGKPFLSYQQRTWDPAGLPLHAEYGYVRPVTDGGVELVVAQPSGITEIHAGTMRGTDIRLHALDVGLTPSAKAVTAVTRHLRVDGDTLSYRLEMAAVGQDLQFHLEATLQRVG